MKLKHFQLELREKGKISFTTQVQAYSKAGLLRYIKNYFKWVVKPAIVVDEKRSAR